MIAATVATLTWIRGLGPITAPHTLLSPATPPPSAATHHELAHVLLALSVVSIAARAVGLLFQNFLRQPRVMGEITAGLLLGPSLLGAASPELYHFLMPDAIAPLLGVVAKLGVVLFMFLVGLEFDGRLLRGSSHATVAISHASIVFPFLLGASLALWIFPRYAGPNADFTIFALFLGVAMSVTAFPVLARILTDQQLSHTPLGATALACAAIDDVTAWCLLAFVSSVAKAQPGDAARTVGLVIGFLVVLWIVVRPLAEKLAARHAGPLTQSGLALVFGVLLLCAAATEAIGIHALFGAFAFGVAFPRHPTLGEQIRERLEDTVVVLFLPVFFALTGMRTRIGLVATAGDWAVCALIIVVATAGKFGGSTLAGRFMGMRWRDASALGILMNTRGLMELIVLNVGLDMGVLSPTLFAMMVLMALVTTVLTTPVLQLVWRPSKT